MNFIINLVFAIIMGVVVGLAIVKLKAWYNNKKVIKNFLDWSGDNDKEFHQGGKIYKFINVDGVARLEEIKKQPKKVIATANKIIKKPKKKSKKHVKKK